MTRIYCPEQFKIGGVFLIPTYAGHHLRDVLRKKVGGEIVVFNGLGGEFIAKIISFLKTGEVKIEILKFCPEEKNKFDFSPKISIIQSILKSTAMDYVIQKVVEIGIDRIIPVFSDRSNVKLQNFKIKNKVDHWEKIVISSVEQSGRCDVPKITAPISFVKAISSISEDCTKLICTLTGQSIVKFFKDYGFRKEIVFCIGPEGDWSNREERYAIDSCGFNGISLGKNILRAETAAVKAISQIDVFFSYNHI